MNVESIADSEGNSRDNRRRIGFRILAGAVSALMLCSVSSSWNDADARSHKKTSKHGDELDTSTSEKKHKPGDEDSISGASPMYQLGSSISEASSCFVVYPWTWLV